jgi:succinyl-CoA synthetase beta subunit
MKLILLAWIHMRLIKIPVVVRMEGTNVELGQKMLTESGLDFTVAHGMKDAAEKVVRLAR